VTPCWFPPEARTLLRCLTLCLLPAQADGQVARRSPTEVLDNMLEQATHHIELLQDAW
jgi:hypothetical protein